MIGKVILFLCFSLSIISCKKDSTEIYAQSAKDAALGERLIADVLKQILSTAPIFLINEQDSLVNGIILSSKPANSSSAYPKKIIIDYGEGVIGPLGKMRKGKIIVSVNSGTIIQENLAVSFDQFNSDGSEIWGDLEYVYNDIVSGYMGEILNNGISIINANGTIKFNGTFVLSKTSTSGTLSLADDSYTFTCNTTGIDLNQTSFSYITSDDHVIDFSCVEYIKSGISVIEPNNKAVQTINFGSGKCDANAVIKLSNGSEKNFIF
jgi:hypothetical protein